jgi:hypothetical protein
MLRSLTIVALMGLFVGALQSTSEAGASLRSFKVEASDGTDAGIAFNAILLGDVRVHTPEGDFNGTFVEIPLGATFSFVFAFANDNGYVGSFSAFVTDLTPLVPGTATINGTLLGSTGLFTFEGRAKN